jgi:CubicO group peptidase (beta-lactamase class C family)
MHAHLSSGSSRPSSRLRRWLVVPPVVLAVVLAGRPAAPVAALGPQAAVSGPAVFPGARWGRIADPASVGFCRTGLDRVDADVKQLGTTGMLIVVGGRELWSYGDLTSVSYVASVRKSILAMLYGRYVESGRIDLNATLEDLGMTDVGGLLPREQRATVLDLLEARSGVYHEAANAACSGCGSTDGPAPPRGSITPGTYFLYNNWDFNALGTIFEQQTGQNIYDAFQHDLAGPTGMQDFDRAAQRKAQRPAVSIHPAYHFYLSTRDMARIGYLMLRGGSWNGAQLVPADWARRIVTPVTHVPDMHPDDLTKGPFGYGLLWWVWDAPFNAGAYAGAYTGIGAIGQYITVLPALDLVIAHKTQPRTSSPVTHAQYLALVDAVVKAHCGTTRNSERRP